MRFETAPHLRLGQQMKLAPRMIQSMEILQLPAPALEERIDQELESNIALETWEPEAESEHEHEHDRDGPASDEERRESDRADREGERELVADADGGSADFERLDTMERDYREAFDNEYSAASAADDPWSRRRGVAGDEEGQAKIEAMANTAARSESLGEQLLRQWALADVDESTRRAGEQIIQHLDGDGYLRTDLADIADADRGELDVETLEDALAEVQTSLDPSGIGARNLAECLRLQLDAREREDPDFDAAVPRLLVEHYLGDIEANRLPRIAEKSGLSLDQIKTGIEVLRGLDPRPGRRLVPDSPSLVVPDAMIEYDEGRDEYIARLTRGSRPQLRVSPEYATMARDRAVDRDTRKFVDENVRQARWLIDAIEQRSHTLLRVIGVVLVHQRDFFEQGESALKPLPMTQVADQLGVHVATVSRAVNGKWVQTPRGILPLRRFFSAGTERRDGSDMSWEAVRAVLKEIVDAEDKAKPLGDDALSKALADRGINIARRTVAKYRDQLGIPAARLRKEY